MDPIVLTNAHVDDAALIGSDNRLPYDDGTFDLIYCDWVLEHIAEVAPFVAEVERVLRPGGWFCARTPNKWGYIALGSRLLPEKLEASVLRRVQPKREEKDVFPKYYRLNTLSQLRRAFPAGKWLNCSFSLNATPAYHGGMRLAFDLTDWFQKLTPSTMNTVLLAFIQKRGEPVLQPAVSNPTQERTNA